MKTLSTPAVEKRGMPTMQSQRCCKFTKTCTVIRKIGGARRNRIGFSFLKTLSGNFHRRMEKEMKTKSKISGHIIRSAVYAVFLSVAFIAA